MIPQPAVQPLITNGPGQAAQALSSLPGGAGSKHLTTTAAGNGTLKVAALKDGQEIASGSIDVTIISRPELSLSKNNLMPGEQATPHSQLGEQQPASLHDRLERRSAWQAGGNRRRDTELYRRNARQLGGNRIHHDDGDQVYVQPAETNYDCNA